MLTLRSIHAKAPSVHILSYPIHFQINDPPLFPTTRPFHSADTSSPQYPCTLHSRNRVYHLGISTTITIIGEAEGEPEKGLIGKEKKREKFNVCAMWVLAHRRLSETVQCGPCMLDLPYFPRFGRYAVLPLRVSRVEVADLLALG